MAALGETRQIGLVSPSYGVYRPVYRDKLNDGFVDTLLDAIEPYRSNYLDPLQLGQPGSRLRLNADSFLDIYNCRSIHNTMSESAIELPRH